MVPQDLNIEMGKLMATVVNLQTEVGDIKNELHTLNKYILSMHDQIKKEYIARSELAPVKTILGAVSVTTATAICVALLNLILK